MKSFISVSFFLCIGYLGWSQNLSEQRVVHSEDVSKLSDMQKMEDTLAFLADSMLLSQIPEARVEGSYAFIKAMRRFLQMPNSFKEPLKKLTEKIYITAAPDGKFRFFTWEIVQSNTEIRYYGVIQFNNGSYQPLIDVSDQIIRGGEDSVFYNMRWYGAIYYNILQKKIGDVDAYFLLGYNGNAINGDKKILDVFGFDQQGRGIFGAPVFSILDDTKRRQAMRYIMNYQGLSRVSMNYDNEKGMIIFDHCESQIGDNSKKSTYVPDGTYDGFKWENNMWIMYRNVVQITELPDGGAPIEKPIKN